MNAVASGTDALHDRGKKLFESQIGVQHPEYWRFRSQFS